MKIKSFSCIPLPIILSLCLFASTLSLADDILVLGDPNSVPNNGSVIGIVEQLRLDAMRRMYKEERARQYQVLHQARVSELRQQHSICMGRSAMVEAQCNKRVVDNASNNATACYSLFSNITATLSYGDLAQVSYSGPAQFGHCMYMVQSFKESEQSSCQLENQQRRLLCDQVFAY